LARQAVTDRICDTLTTSTVRRWLAGPGHQAVAAVPGDMPQPHRRENPDSVAESHLAFGLSNPPADQNQDRLDHVNTAARRRHPALTTVRSSDRSARGQGALTELGIDGYAHTGYARRLRPHGGMVGAAR
jgi:hypothetical protein